MQEKILSKHVKRDPLPQERIDQIKSEILEEIENMSPRSRKGGVKSKSGIPSSSSRIGGASDVEDDLSALDADQTSMKDLIAQIN